MSEIEISIIVPVYNIENYIVECVNSILGQTFKKYEIILVDDGSTDKSPEICDKFAKENKSIRVIHKENGGLSDARNAGISISQGKYIMFVDGDDFLYDKTCLERIERELGNSDILQYKMVYYYPNKKFVELKDIVDIESENSFEDKLYKLICNGSISISACDKIISREYLLKNNLFFEKNLISEDVHWSLRLYINEPTLKIFNSSIYVYRKQRENSITNTKNKEKTIRSELRILDYWYDYEYLNPRVREIYYSYLAYLYLILLLNSEKLDQYTKDVEKYRTLLKYDGHYKVKIAKKAMRFVGFNGMIFLMKCYSKLNNNGIIKL